MSKPPSILLLAIMLASALALLGALAAGGVAAFALPQILWASLGFALVAAVSAAIGVLAGLGRFNRGLGMAALCVAGAIAVSAGFSMIDLRPNLTDQPSLARLLKPWVGAQVIAACVITAAGGLAVLARRPRSWGSIAYGVAFLVPAALIVGGIVFGLGRIPEGESGRVISLAVLLVGGTIAGALGSIGGHHLIRAFELTADDPAPKG